MARATPEDWMHRAIELSRQGFPAPNPRVGCVIVQGDTAVGEGFHAYAGGRHAEAEALARAGELARGADVYVTLEPCAHHGRTPPCAAALISAGVATVHYAVSDPNPVASGGAQQIASAGIAVTAGMCEAEAAFENRRFLTAVRRAQPFIVLKAATTLDGRIALPCGESKWITGEPARSEGQRLRAEMGAVLVGSATVQRDDPQLNVRLPGVHHQPVKIVLDRYNQLSGTERIFQEGEVRHLTGEIDLDSMLRTLFEEGITGLLVEGGAYTFSSFVKAGLYDEIELFVAPALMGEGVPWIQTNLADTMAEVPRLSVRQVRRVGNDIQISLSK